MFLYASDGPMVVHATGRFDVLACHLWMLNYKLHMDPQL